jgi:eukaryotic-like serine/threonine-protein kinase
MKIDSGSRLGPYEVVSAIGAGGMGEVWRAKDTRLDRDVAIKILPAAFASNAQLRVRFDREAKAISSLNHPNICTLHDVGHEDGVHYLVMELIEGESLADRIRRGPLPPEQVLRYGAQIATALDAAHRQGVVHRDLKPGNVMITKSGAKLLDFGLAKSTDSAILGAQTALATEHKPITEQGTILGTYQYMSPEQLEGAEVDARTDIFALGAVLYEMATGKRAFDGTTKTSLIAAIVSSQPPPMSSVAPMTPPALDHVVRKCLEKDPDERWQSAHDVASELRWISEAGSQAGVAIGASRRRDTRKAAIAVALLLAGLVAGALGHRELARRSAPLPRPFQYIIEHGNMHQSRPAISPDGRSVAYTRDHAIVVRDLGRLEAVTIAGTEGGTVPFWSPDGQWIAFTADRKLWKVRLDGGGKTLLASLAPATAAGGGVWLPDGRIVFTTGGSGLYEVRDRGGDAREILAPEANEADFHFVSELPDGKGFLFVPHEGDRFNSIVLWNGRERKTLLSLPGQIIAKVAYADSGHILFERTPEGRGVWALPFSLNRMEVTGEPFPIVRFGGNPSVAGSTLVYAPALPPVMSEIVEVDRTGRVLRTIGAPRRGLYPMPALSPDGRFIAIPIFGERDSDDLWLYDVASGEPTRLTFDETGDSNAPVWTPDGSELVYTRWRSTEEYVIRAVTVDRSRTRELGKGVGPVAFTDNGRTILYNIPGKGFDWNLWQKSFADDQPGEEFLAEPGNELQPAISPDGRLFAYNHAGNILIRTLPERGGPWQVATGGASSPRWSRNGDRIFYLAGDDLMEVPVSTNPSIRVGTPKRLFSFTHSPTIFEREREFALTADETFIMVRPVELQPGIVVVQNWEALIETSR